MLPVALLFAVALAGMLMFPNTIFAFWLRVFGRRMDPATMERVLRRVRLFIILILSVFLLTLTVV